ncbi:MAG: hypothetical protein AVDCRST_MAG11-942, partial [uncultured Gemmatimonadaceae bacterium]
MRRLRRTPPSDRRAARLMTLVTD